MLSQLSFRRVLTAAETLRPRLLAWSRAVVSAGTSRWVGTLLLTMSALALLGWFADVWWLAQPLQSFPPMRFGTALGFFILGAGIFASSYPRRSMALALAWMAIAIGSIPLQHAVGFEPLWTLVSHVSSPVGIAWHGAPPDQMPIASAVFIVLGGIGLIAIVSRERGLWSSISLAVAGGIVMLLATTVVAGQAMGFLDGVQYGPLLGSALQCTISAIIFSTHFNALAWTKQSGFSPPPAWLPLSVGAGSLVTVLILWRALISSEEARLADRSRVAATAMHSAVVRQIGTTEHALRRMARHSIDPSAMWTSFVSQMINDVPGLEMIVWADSTGQRRGGDTLNTAARVASVLATVQRSLPGIAARRDSTTFLLLEGDPSRTVMIVPRCPTVTRCSDLFVALVSAPDVLGSIVGDTVLGFDMAIGARDRWFRATSPTVPVGARWFVRAPIRTAGPGWELGAWPKPRVAATAASSLSDFVLLLGIAVSVLLAVALRLAQVVSTTARMEERATIDRALQSTTDGLWEWDLLTGEVTRSSQLWSRLGYGDGDGHRLMQDWLALVHPQDRARVEARLHDHLESRVDAFEAQYRVRSASGRWHDFIDRGRVVLRSSTGQPLRLLGMFADVTDRRHAEESLRQAETMSTMGRLAARIAHEINNPLAGIQSAFLLIKDAIPPTHPHVKYVGAIEREVQRISQVTRQLYETYRPETESSTHAPVQTVVGDAVAFLEQVNRNTGVTISVELGGIAAVVRLSDSLLRQCIYNLVQNAVEASPRGANVLVSGAIDGDDFVLRVRDQGPGVPPDLRESIFDPFVSTKPSQLSTGGMGLGLSLVRRAVDAAGGSIHVVDAVGGGAEFIARIPLVETTVSGVSA